MTSRFSPAESASLLARCHRRCCLCHRFCGVKMEIHHIEQAAHGGGNDLDNGMPLCFDCHAEVNHYNNDHPRGRRFSPAELRAHRDEWLRICGEHPQIFVASVGREQAGPLEALVNELEFNLEVASRIQPQALGCMFLDAQFGRAIESGAIALLEADIKSRVLAAYAATRRVNFHLQIGHTGNEEERGRALGRAQEQMHDAFVACTEAHHALQKYLGLAPPDVELTHARLVPNYPRPATPSSKEILQRLDKTIWAITEYERVHDKNPTGHHHVIGEHVATVASWFDEYRDSAPPGIRPVLLVAAKRAWSELHTIKTGMRTPPPASVAKLYLKKLGELKKVLNNARTTYRDGIERN